MDSDSEEDRKERDEFVERLQKRDESHKRKVVSRSGTEYRITGMLKFSCNF